MTKYIDRDMLIIEGWHMERIIRAMTSITIEVKKPTDFPAADVVEIVRCKDCDLWNEWDKSGHEQTGNYACSCAYFSNEDGYTVYTGLDDYCSKGERR